MASRRWVRNRVRDTWRPLRERGVLTAAPGLPRPAATWAARRADYERDGYVLGERLLDPARLRALRTEFDRVHAQSRTPAAGIDVRLVRQDGTHYDCVYAMHEHSAAFDALIRDPHLLEMLTALTGETTFLHLLNQVQAKPPRIGGPNGWHRDKPTFPFIEPYTAITAWITLDDATEERGCLRMVPGSQAWDAERIARDWAIPQVPEVYAGHRVRKVDCPVPAGWVHFHDDRVWHGSRPNVSRAPRRALAVHYVAADVRHAAGRLSEFKHLPHGAAMADVLPIRLETPEPGQTDVQRSP